LNLPDAGRTLQLALGFGAGTKNILNRLIAQMAAVSIPGLLPGMKKGERRLALRSP